MVLNKKLIYVSNNAFDKDNNINPFLLHEISSLVNKFDAFYIVCNRGIYFCDNNHNIKKIHNVKKIYRLIAFIKTIFNKEFIKELHSMIMDKKFSLQGVKKLVYFTFYGELLYHLIKHIKFENNNNTIFYSFWLSYDAYAIAKCKKNNPNINTIARAHSYELQINRNPWNPYMMKNFIISNIDHIYFISKDSLNEILKYQDMNEHKFHINYLGSSSENTGYIKRCYERLKIVSCSSIVKVKQINWIIEALANWNYCKIEWVHIGDGPEAHNVEELAKEKLNKNPNISYEFKGFIRNDLVKIKLQDDSINLFINTSASEGVPVSIMEAMSVGIPIIAPNINGIPELVDSSCGILFEKAEGVEGVYNAIKQYYMSNEAEKIEMGYYSYEKWKNMFCLEKNIGNIFKAI